MTGRNAPLILTAELPPELHARYTALRTAHFPPERNFLQAHVTLFHALPPMIEGELVELGKRLAGEFAPVAGRVAGVQSLGRGTAIRLESAGMLDLREIVAERFHGLLTGQDQHRPRLHVTVQNKVRKAEARALQAELEGQILPRDFHFPGLALHVYRGGPWELLRRFAFRGK